MSDKYNIVYVEKPEEAAWGIIGGGIHRFNVEHAGESNFQRICFVLEDPEGEIVGGVLGELYWGWFYLDLIWVVEELRGRGYGNQLLKTAEEGARQRGARHVYLDTFSFQAPEFYEKHGYRVFGELGDFPEGHRRYFLTKAL